MTKHSISIVAIGIMAVASPGLAHNNKHAINDTVIEFQKGQEQLAQSAKDSLDRLINDARAHGQIATVEVAVWSDEPFPANNKDLSDADQSLADNRGDQVESYLKNNLNVSDVRTFNMAEGSNWLSRTFKTDAAELKSVFSKEEAPAMERKDFNLIREDGGTGKAVVVVKKKMIQAPANDAMKY